MGEGVELFTEYLIFLIKCQYKYPSCLGGKKKFTVSQRRIYSHGYPSGFPTLDKSHFYYFSLLLSGACIGVKDLASSLEKELAYCFERYRLPQSQVLKLFSFPEVLSQIHA